MLAKLTLPPLVTVSEIQAGIVKLTFADAEEETPAAVASTAPPKTNVATNIPRTTSLFILIESTS
jgi:hypothetical protein